MGEIKTEEMIDAQPHHCISFLNIVMMSETILEALEDVKKTHLYRHSLKSKINLLVPELEKVIEKDLGKVWGVDDNAMYRLIDQQRTLIHRLSTSRPEVWSILNEVLDQYDADKGSFLTRNEIIIND